MKVLSISPEKPEPGTIIEAAGYIRRGFVVAVPTDTVYGLVANGLDENAISRLFAVKKRPVEKAVALFVKNIAMARKLAYISDDVCERLKTVWPGAVTAVLYKKDIVPARAAAGGETIALRLSSHPVVAALLQAVDVPLAEASANLSGVKPARNAEDVIEEFKRASLKPDLVLNAGALPDVESSTVVDLTKGKPQLLRVGPVTKRDLAKLWTNR